MNWTPQEKVTLRYALRQMLSAAQNQYEKDFATRWAAEWGVTLEVPQTPQQRRLERQALGIQRPRRRG